MASFKQIGLPALFTLHYKEMRDFDKDLCKELEGLVRSLDALLNSGLKFADNVDCRLVSVTSHGTPGIEFSVTHTLGKATTGYIVYRQSGAGSVYDGTTTNTSTTLYLKSDVATKVFYLIVF